MRQSERLATALVLLMVLLGLSSASPLDLSTRFGGADGPGATSPQSLSPSPAPQLASAQFPAIADSFLDSMNPSRNYGRSGGVVIGGDPANASALRGVVQFNVDSISPIATILNATLRARVLQGPAGQIVNAYRVRAPWSEGDGTGFGFRQAINVVEPAGVPRLREPVDLLFTVPVPYPAYVKSDFRVFDDRGTEVPSQVYGATYAGADVTSVHVVFEATVRAFQTRTYFLYYGNRVPTVPSFRANTFGNLLGRYPAGAKYANLAAVDLNGDGKLEVVFGSNDGYVYAIQWNGSLLWKHKAADVVDYFSTAVDVDGDGQLEVVYATVGSVDNRIYALSADGLTEKWNTSTLPTKGIYAPIAIADIDGNGIKTLFAGASDRILYAFYGNNGTLRWSYLLPGTAWGYGAVVANLTGGPEPEILYTQGSGDFFLLNKDGTPAWPAPASPSGRTTQVTASVADIDGDGRLDIVAGDNAINGNEFAFRGTDGTNLWVTGTTSDQFGGQILVDFQNDGFPETAFTMTRRGSLGMIDHNGIVRWTAPLGDKSYAVPATADVNLDGVEEILIGAGDPVSPTNPGLVIVDANGNVTARFNTTDPVTATPIVADLDGDGTMEIVFASRTTTYIYSSGSLGHDFRTGAYNYNLTGRFLDGNSPDGAPLLRTSVGPVENLVTTGVTWLTRDGTTSWAAPGSDYDANLLASSPVAGPDTWVTWNVTSLVQSWTSIIQPNAGILLKVANENFGGLTTLSSREVDPAFAATLDVQYLENLKPRILSPVPDQLSAEDGPLWELNLIGYASDPDTPFNLLRWDLSGVNANLYDFSGGNITGNHILTFQPRPDAYGNNLVRLFLFDDGDHYDSQLLWINITPVNDAPVFTPPSTLYAKCGEPYPFDFSPYIVDVDTPMSGLTMRSDDATHAMVSGFTVTFSYPSSPCPDWKFVILTIDDGQVSSSQAITIRLTTDAPPRRIAKLPDVVLLEGETKTDVFDLDNYFVDPDSDSLYYTEGFKNVDVTIKANHSVDFRAVGNWSGIERGVFRALDPTGAIAEDAINVTVIPVNDPPTIASFPPWVVHYDVPYRFDLSPYVSDPDTPLTQIRIRTSIPSNITVQGMELEMLFPQVWGATPAPYTLDVTITANDTVDETSRDTRVTVTDDLPPELRNMTQLPDVYFEEDTVKRDRFDLDGYFVDNDSPTIFYSSGQVNVVVTIKANHSVDFTAVKDWNGFERVTFRAMDDRGAYAESTIRVTVRPVNDAPFFKELPVITANEPTFFFDIRDYVDDVDNPNSSLHVTTSSGNVRIEGFILIFAYPSDVREDVVNLTVTDPVGASGSVNLEVRIIGPDILMAVLPWLLLLAAAAAVFFAVRLLRTVVEHVFLIYGSGIPLGHLSRSVATDKDPDLIASMFTAIQSFMNESFHSMGVGELKSLELADHRVALVRGEFVLLVVLYRGRASSHVENKADEVVHEIEKRFRDVLKDWNGDVDRITGVRELLANLYGVAESGQSLKTFDVTEFPGTVDPGLEKR